MSGFRIDERWLKSQEWKCSESISKPVHRSFRLTPSQAVVPAYMKGRRVKRRLLLVFWICGLTAMTAFFWTFTAARQMLAGFGKDLLVFHLVMIVTLSAFSLTGWAVRKLAVLTGLMSPEEEKAFPMDRGARWAECWLEPIPGKNPQPQGPPSPDQLSADGNYAHDW